LHHYLCPVAATGARSTQHAIHRPRATVQLAGPVLGSFSARTRFVVLALIPVAGFLANAGEGNVGRAFATVTQSTRSSTPAGISRAQSRSRPKVWKRRCVNSSPTCRRHDLAAEQW
ncbi:MAG: hypothetical protein WBE32_01435, partial [Pseudolabrys sp.]